MGLKQFLHIGTKQIADNTSASDLPTVKVVNTTGTAGTINSTVPVFTPTTFRNIVDGEMKDSTFMSIYNSIYNWHMSKFEYKNLPLGLTKQHIEYILWMYNEGVLFEMGGKYYFTQFRVEEYDDINGDPIKVKPMSLDSDKGTELNSLTVDKDCIIIRNSTYGLLRNVKHFRSLAYSVLDPINAISREYQNVINNSNSSLEFLAIGDDVDDITLKNINQAIASGERIVKFDPDSLGEIAVVKGGLAKGGQVQFTDRTDSIIKTTTHIWQLLKTVIGMQHEQQMNQARQNQEQTNSDKQFSSSLIQTEFDQRKQDLLASSNMGLNITVEKLDIFKDEIELDPVGGNNELD